MPMITPLSSWPAADRECSTLPASTAIANCSNRTSPVSRSTSSSTAAAEGAQWSCAPYSFSLISPRTLAPRLSMCPLPAARTTSAKVKLFSSRLTWLPATVQSAASPPKASAAAVASACFSSSQALCTAVPIWTVVRCELVPGNSSSLAVSGEPTTTWLCGTSSVRAATTAIIVYSPAPTSGALCEMETTPFSSTDASAVAWPIPEPRRIAIARPRPRETRSPGACSLGVRPSQPMASVARRSRSAMSESIGSTSAGAGRPSRFQVSGGKPSPRARRFFTRRSSGFIPIRRATSSSIESIAKLGWFLPVLRNTPAGTLFVYAVCARTRKWGMRYAPQAAVTAFPVATRAPVK